MKLKLTNMMMSVSDHSQMCFDIIVAAPLTVDDSQKKKEKGKQQIDSGEGPSTKQRGIIT